MSEEARATKVLKPEEAARYIKCSEYTIKEMARMGKIPYFRIGKLIRFTEEGLEKWIKERENDSIVK